MIGGGGGVLVCQCVQQVPAKGALHSLQLLQCWTVVPEEALASPELQHHFSSPHTTGVGGGGFG